MLPSTLVIDNTEYGIDPSFSNCLEIIRMYEDPDLLDEVKHAVAIRMLFNTQKVPPLCNETVEAMLWFLDGGESEIGDTPNLATVARNQKSKRVYSLDQDWRYIRSAIQRTHGVNLREQDDLHWWKFIDMFMDLDEDCTFSRILYLRVQKSKNKLTKEEKKIWADMKDILVIRSPESAQAAKEAAAFEDELKRLESLKGGVTHGAVKN